jgi:precorrin-6A synthase
MRKIFVIGIGVGNPDYITVQAINALNAADVFFVVDKGEEKADLVRLRKEICARHIKARAYRFAEVPDPQRDRAPRSYESAVLAWHDQRAEIYQRLIAQELGEDQCGAFLVWGDPSLYDSTLRIIDAIIQKRTLAFDYEVIPGVSAIQALAAAHRIALNRIGRSVHITTGRKLAEDFSGRLPDGVDDVVVMLDGECSFKTVEDPYTEIYWGAYLGTPDEILVAGRLGECAQKIERLRTEARARKGWIMDTYLLRKPG